MSSGLKNNVISLTILQLANYIVPLLLVPFLLKELGSVDYGKIAVILGITQFCYIITEFGFSQSATAKIAENVADVNYVSRMNGSVVIIKTLISVICIICSCSVIVFQGYGGWFVCSSISAIIIFQALQPIWFFNGIERMGNISIFLISSKMMYCVLTVVFILWYKEYQLAIFSMAISHFIGFIIGIWFLLKTKYRILIPSFNEVKLEFYYSLQFFWARGAVSLYTSLCVVLVGTFGGLHQAAIFSVCEQIFKAGKAVTAPLCQALYPYLIRTNNWMVFFKLFIYSAFIMLFGCVIVGLFSDDVLKVIFNINEPEAGVILRVLVCGVYISFLSVYFGHLALVPLKKVKIANNSVLIGAVFFIIINFIFYINNDINALNMSLAILATELSIALIRVIAFARTYRIIRLGNAYGRC